MKLRLLAVLAAFFVCTSNTFAQYIPAGGGGGGGPTTNPVSLLQGGTGTAAASAAAARTGLGAAASGANNDITRTIALLSLQPGVNTTVAAGGGGTVVTLTAASKTFQNGDASAGQLTYGLPDATTCPGIVFHFQRMDGADFPPAFTISATNGQTIDTVGSIFLTPTQYMSAVVYSNGTNWNILNSQNVNFAGPQSAFANTAGNVLLGDPTTLSPVVRLTMDCSSADINAILPSNARTASGQCFMVCRTDSNPAHSGNIVTQNGFSLQTNQGNGGNQILPPRSTGFFWSDGGNPWRGTIISDSPTSSFVFGHVSTVTSAATRYLYPGSGVSSATEIQIRIPRAMTFVSIGVDSTTAPGGILVDTFTVRKNGVDTTLTISLTGAATTNSLGGQAVSFAAGDLMSISLVSGLLSADANPMVTVEGY